MTPAATHARRSSGRSLGSRPRPAGRSASWAVAAIDGAGATRVAGDRVPSDTFADAFRSFVTRSRQYSVVSIDGREYASAVIPFKVAEPIIPVVAPPKTTRLPDTGDHNLAPTVHRPPPPATVTRRYLIVVRKSIPEIQTVVHVITRAFLEAAAAGLILTLLLGIGALGAAGALASDGCAGSRSRSSKTAPARLCRSIERGTRSATSPARWPRCRSACDSRRRPAGRSSPPPRTSCARR